MDDLNLDWYTYLTENFKLDRSAYKTADKAVVDCPRCEGTDCVRVSHLKAKIKKLGYYECSTCRKRDSIQRARKACNNKYNGKNPFELQSVKEKIKKTNLEKYGVDCLLKKEEIRLKGVEKAANIRKQGLF